MYVYIYIYIYIYILHTYIFNIYIFDFSKGSEVLGLSSFSFRSSFLSYLTPAIEPSSCNIIKNGSIAGAFS